jgi:hypothetical protein
MILIVTGSLSLNLCRYNSFIDSQIYMSYLPSFKMSPLISLELSKIPNENGKCFVLDIFYSQLNE